MRDDHGDTPTGGLSTTVEPLRVLLVDDHAAVREAVASDFESEPDFDVVGQAACLAEARQMLGGVDVVILDLGLPDGSGAELIPELRAANPNAHAVVLSATYDPAMASELTEYGATAVLDKLTHLGQVAQATRRILAGGRRQRTPRNAPRMLADGLQIVVSRVGKTTTISFEGEWDLAAREATCDAIDKELVDRPDSLVLDLSRLSFIDSSGVHILVDLERCSAGMSIRLLIVPGPRAVHRIFEICQISDRLPFTKAA
jgi:anti-anti-sigma factor